MADDDPAKLAGTRHARSMLAESETALSDVLVAFNLMTEHLLSDEGLSPGDVVRLLGIFAQTRTKLIDEVTKYENRVLFNEGKVAHAPLDFDKLRDQIGSKLDRIRASRGSEGLSEGSDD